MGDVRYAGARGDLQLLTTLNFEGYTLRRGELNAGMYGEGYVDRRHPHTFVHEAMLAYITTTSPTRHSPVHGDCALANGRGRLRETFAAGTRVSVRRRSPLLESHHGLQTNPHGCRCARSALVP